jgi:hypothetical protein
MPKYKYVGVKNKKRVKGEIQAKSESDARASLRGSGIEPLEVSLPRDYKKIQFISYQLNTFPSSDYVNRGKRTYMVDGMLRDILTLKFDKTYLADTDSAKDIENRIELVKEAIETAAANPEISSDTNCLKLFMVPEFYFRGSTGAYSLDDYQEVIEKLRGLVQDDKWKHWLFVFGTVLAVFEPLAIETQGSRGEMNGRKAVLNTALVQKGAGGEGKSNVVVKDVMSDIDFPKQKELTFDTNTGSSLVLTRRKKPDDLWDDDVDHLKAGKQKGWWIFKKWSDNQKAGKENQVANYSGLGIFEMDNITFGLEVCLDHALQRLRKSPPAKKQNWIQVQLIPSAGMTPMKKSVIACKGGWVFNCDGNAQTFVHEVERDWKDAGDAVLKAALNPAAEFEIHTAGDGAKRFKESFQGKAHLRIFKPKPIPAARVV